MKFTLINLGGRELDMSSSYNFKTLNVSNEFIAGVCSVLLLFSEAMASSFMIIKNSAGETVDPEKFLENYFLCQKILDGGVLKELKDFPRTKKYFIILGYLGLNILYQFESFDFLNGIKHCCKILCRDHSRIVVMHNAHHKITHSSSALDEIVFKGLSTRRTVSVDGSPKLST